MQTLLNIINVATEPNIIEDIMKQGGKREGAGRKLKFKEETTTIAFRVPVSKANEIKSKIEKLLMPYLKTKNGK